MKLVTFSKTVAPFSVGDKRLVPDDLAEKLKRDDAISASELWPAPQMPDRPMLKPDRLASPAGRRIAK